MFNKIELVNEKTLIIGIDIAKKIHWARFTNSRGITIGKPFKIENTAEGTVADVAKHCRTFEFTEPFGYRRKTLWEHICADYFDMIICPAEIEINHPVLEQILLKILLSQKMKFVNSFSQN